MAIKQPDILEHNNSSLPIVDQQNVKGGYYTVDTILERNAIPIAKRGNMLVHAIDEGLFRYVKKNDFSDSEWIKTVNWKPAGESIQDTDSLPEGALNKYYPEIDKNKVANVPADTNSELSTKLDKNQVPGLANRRFVVNADGSTTVAPELGHLQSVDFIDSADADTAKDTLRFTFIGGSAIDVDVKELFDIGAFSNVAKGSGKTIDFTTLGGVNIPLNLGSWFTNYDTHVSDTDIHITAQERINWSNKSEVITTVLAPVTRNLTNADSGKLIVTDNDIVLTIPVGLINTFNASFSPLTGGKITFAFASGVLFHAPNGVVTFEDNTTTLIFMPHNSKYLVRP